MTAAKSTIKDLLHLFFPHVCSGCGSDIITPDRVLCLRCINELPVTNFFQQKGNPVEQKFYGRMPVRYAGAAYFFTKDSLLQNLIYDLKYRGSKEIGTYLGKLMGTFLNNAPNYQSIDALIPLPLNPKRQRKRGYNQALAIAEGIAAAWPKPVIENAVIRKVYTETQTHRGRLTRWENMQDVFEVVQPTALEGKHLLLIDDVLTTGASVEACGTEMLKVSGVTLSIATAAYTL